MTLEKLTLTDEERALVRRLPARTGHVAVIEFFNGPRGRRFRPVRSAVYATAERAERENEQVVLQRRYHTRIRKVEIVRVDALGRVQV